VIDENENVKPEYYLNTGHYDNLNFDKNRWLNSYSTHGVEEIENALSVRNTIPNVSAVLIRTASLRQIDFAKAKDFTCGGDWFVYVSILKTGKVFYLPDHLNYHRRHDNSVVSQNKTMIENTVPDYFKMHKYIIEHFNISASVFELMTNSVVSGLRNIWPNCSDEEFSLHYNVNQLKELIENKTNEV